MSREPSDEAILRHIFPAPIVKIEVIVGEGRPDAIALTSDKTIFQSPDAVNKAKRYCDLINADDGRRDPHGGAPTDPLDGAIMWEIGVEGDRFRPHRYNADCRAAGCVPVGDELARSHIDVNDATHVLTILNDPKADWFGAQLLKLISHADYANQEALGLIYPDYVAAYRRAINDTARGVW